MEVINLGLPPCGSVHTRVPRFILTLVLVESALAIGAQCLFDTAIYWGAGKEKDPKNKPVSVSPQNHLASIELGLSQNPGTPKMASVVICCFPFNYPPTN